MILKGVVVVTEETQESVLVVELRAAVTQFSARSGCGFGLLKGARVMMTRNRMLNICEQDLVTLPVSMLDWFLF